MFFSSDLYLAFMIVFEDIDTFFNFFLINYQENGIRLKSYFFQIVMQEVRIVLKYFFRNMAR